MGTREDEISGRTSGREGSGVEKFAMAEVLN